MIRLSLSDLDEAIRNPVAYREKMTQGDRSRFFPPKSYFTVLRNAIFKFHSSDNNLAEGQDYLTAKLVGFKDYSRLQDTIDQFNWYVQDYSNSNLVTFSCRQNVVIRPATAAEPSLEWSGQVSRLDIRPVGGYAAWLFRNKDPEGWFNELRMPLIQDELSNSLNVPLAEISIGIYSFQDRFVDFRYYSAQNVADAQNRLQALSLALDL
jgi:hypothetical protein